MYLFAYITQYLYINFIFQGHFKANPFWQQNIKTFAREKAEYQSNVYPKNSPLVPLFNR